MKISIITIVYNNREHIASCIESVLRQTYPDVEHLVIDGGSTDGTQAVIENYKDQLGYYRSEPDKGLYNALNKGIKQATGDVIGILHSDDLFYEPDTLKKIVESFKISKADLVYANGMYVDRDAISQVKRVYRSKSFKPNYLNWGWIPLHTTIYVKREIFDDYGLYDERYAIASDYDISLRWFKNPKLKTHFLNEWVVKMRLGGKSTTASLQKKKSAEDLQIIRSFRLPGYITLFSKIGRKIPQYLIPKFKTFS